MMRLVIYVQSGIICAGIILGLAVMYEYDKEPGELIQILGNSLAQQPGVPFDYVYLPEYYKLNLIHSYRANVESLDDFYDWKHNPDGVLMSHKAHPTVHDMPEMNVKKVSSKNKSGDGGAYTLNKYTAPAWSYHTDIVFYELVPENKNGNDAILVIPGSGHQGALDVLGEDGPFSAYYYHDEIGKQLVGYGYTVYTLELAGFGERALDVGSLCPRDDPMCSYTALADKLSRYGVNLNNVQTDEITSVLKYVEAKQFDNIVVMGLSLGAGLATNQMIINEDVIDVLVAASGVGSAIYSPLNMDTGPDCACDGVTYDTADAILTIAPKPMYVSFGTQESHGLRWHAEEPYFHDMLLEVYSLHNKTANLTYVPFDGTHSYEIDSILVFLAQHLG